MAEKISVVQAAEIMGKSPMFVRLALRKGALPFGMAVKTSSVWTYYIYPEKFKEYVGEINKEKEAC